MRTAPVRPSAQDTTPIRDRGDACPGALRLHDADDGALARVRLPGGVLSVPQAGALADAARRFGDGDLHLTSRGNVQLRGLSADCGRELGAALGDAGLLPSRRHERVRNIVASPLAGLDGHGRGHRHGHGNGAGGGDGGVRGWLRELDGMLCASESAHALSGRFLFALDDGRGDMAPLGADVTLVAGEGEGAGGGTAWLCVGPERSPAFRVPSTRAAQAALLTAEAFLQTADASAGRVWRIAELPGGAMELADAVARRLDGAGIAATACARPRGSRTYEPSPGVVTGGGTPGEAALSVLAPMGRVDAAQWRTLMSAADAGSPSGGTGTGELRLTPWRGVVVPGVPACEADERLRVLASAGLITGPDDPRAGVGSCIGTSGCARSLADVRADAAALTGPGSLPVYWSGCERRCGHPRGDRVEVVAVPEGYRVSAVRDRHVRDATTTAGRASVAAEVARARTSRPTAADSPETVK